MTDDLEDQEALEQAKRKLAGVLQEALALHRETCATAETVYGPDRKLAKKIKKRSARIIAGHLRQLQVWYPDPDEQRRLTGLEPDEIRQLIREGQR